MQLASAVSFVSDICQVVVNFACGESPSLPILLGLLSKGGKLSCLVHRPPSETPWFFLRKPRSASSRPAHRALTPQMGAAGILSPVTLRIPTHSALRNFTDIL